MTWHEAELADEGLARVLGPSGGGRDPKLGVQRAELVWSWEPALGSGWRGWPDAGGAQGTGLWLGGQEAGQP